MRLMNQAALGLACSLLISTPFEASAVQYAGNPNLTLRVDRPAHDYLDGSVTLQKVRVHHCAGGSTDYTQNQAIDPVAGHQVAIGAGDHCGLTFYWSTAMDIDGSGFTVRYAEATTSVTLASTIEPVALTPCGVISGSMGGVCPRLYVTVN